MATIPNLLRAQFQEILLNYSQDILEPSRIVDQFREEIGDNNTYVRKFERINDLGKRNMVAVDGGRTTQKLAGGDLIIVGATLGESPFGQQNYGTKAEIPAEAFGGIVPHTSENQKVEETMMAALELRVLDGAEAGVKIIDGSYLGNTTTVLYGLTNRACRGLTARTLLTYEREQGDGCLLRAIEAILLPKRAPEPGDADVVAVVKSDSSSEFVQAHLLKDNKYPAAASLTDRIYASRLLLPGEFLNPRPLISSRRIINAYNKIDFTEQAKFVGKKNEDLFYNLVRGRDQQLRDLDDSKHVDRSVLWTTYFKPTKWHEYSPVIRIEFAHHNTRSKDQLQRARELISYVDQDIYSPDVMEPMSQYNADRNAKDVSVATDMVKNMLISSAGSMRDALSLIRGYRT